jgi:hypothetical protein
MSRRVRAVLLAALAAAACGVERTQRVGRIEPWPLRAQASGPSVVLRVYGNQRFERGPAELDPGLLRLWRDQALRAYRESGLFASVEDGWEGDGLIAEIGFTVSTRARETSRVLDTSTLTSRRNDFAVRTRFRSRDGRSLGSIDHTEVVRIYTSLPLSTVVGPSPSNRTVREVIYDLNRATLRDALAQGILPTE